MQAEIPLPKTAAPSAPEKLAQSTDGSAVTVWLGVVYAMIFLMVLIGGITRLTGSGLSMVEWRPLMGTLPPLSEEDWRAVFHEYQQFPQYQKVNSWMDLAAFKQIFFWEYVHRLFGRLIGVAVFVPWLYFVARKRLSPRTSRLALGAIFLGACQGFMGWYMVKSGLVDVPAVSHFRLAAHLVLALLCSQWVLWTALDIGAPWRKSAPQLPAPVGGRKLPLLLLTLLYLQITYGAFVAGKRAGYMSSTFPDMNGHYLPGEFFTASTFLDNLLNNPLSLHYLHRLIGTVTLLAFVVAGFWIYRRARVRADQQLGLALLSLVGLQFALGVTTVVFVVPIVPAVAHQGGAVVLLGLVTALLHRAYRTSPKGEGDLQQTPFKPLGAPAPATPMTSI